MSSIQAPRMSSIHAHTALQAHALALKGQQLIAQGNTLGKT